MVTIWRKSFTLVDSIRIIRVFSSFFLDWNESTFFSLFTSALFCGGKMSQSKGTVEPVISWPSRDSTSTVQCYSVRSKSPNEQGGATVEIESCDWQGLRSFCGTIQLLEGTSTSPSHHHQLPFDSKPTIPCVLSLNFENRGENRRWIDD